MVQQIQAEVIIQQLTEGVGYTKTEQWAVSTAQRQKAHQEGRLRTYKCISNKDPKPGEMCADA